LRELSRGSLLDPRLDRVIHRSADRYRNVANNIIDLTEPLRARDPALFAGDIAGADELAEDALLLPAADVQYPANLFEAH